MTEIYIVRHGESEGNKSDKFVGHGDVPLTDTGKRQAALTAEYLKDVKFTALYSSDLKRAMDTAGPSAELHGLKIIPEPDFREIYAGDWEGRLFNEIISSDPEAYNLWKSCQPDCRPGNGETLRELYERVNRRLIELTQENDGGIISIFTHATPIRAITCMIKGIPLTEISSVPWTANASVTRLRFDNQRYEIVGEGYVGHLGGLCTYLSKEV